MKVKADTGGHLSKKLWTSIEQRWLCKEDVALIKALLKEFQFAGQTNILQERWLGEFVPLYRSKDLGAKRRGVSSSGNWSQEDKYGSFCFWGRLFFWGRGSPCCEQVSWDRIFNVKVKADTGGHLSKKLWTSIEQRWLCKEDVALIKALLKEFQFAGQTNILQERWLGEFVPLYRSKDLGAKRRGVSSSGNFVFLPKLCFLFRISGFGGGGGGENKSEHALVARSPLAGSHPRKDMPQQCWWSNLVVRSSIRPSFPCSETTMTHRRQWL